MSKSYHSHQETKQPSQKNSLKTTHMCFDMCTCVMAHEWAMWQMMCFFFKWEYPRRKGDGGNPLTSSFSIVVSHNQDIQHEHGHVGRHLDLPEYSYLGASFNRWYLDQRMTFGKHPISGYRFYNNHSNSLTCSWYCIWCIHLMEADTQHDVKLGTSKRISALGEGLQ